MPMHGTAAPAEPNPLNTTTKQTKAAPQDLPAWADPAGVCNSSPMLRHYLELSRPSRTDVLLAEGLL